MYYTMSGKLKFAVIATDLVILMFKKNKLYVLLTKPWNRNYKNKYSLLGGLVKPTESLNSAAERYVRSFVEYTSGDYLEQIYTFGDVKRDLSGRVVSAAYLGLLSGDRIEKLKFTPKYNYLNWMNARKLPKLAYDHNLMIEKAIELLKARATYTNIVSKLMPHSFTLTELQKCYETILEEKLDKRNFRKKILSLELLKNTGKKTINLNHRPAVLYKFKDTKVVNVRIF